MRSNKIPILTAQLAASVLLVAKSKLPRNGRALAVKHNRDAGTSAMIQLPIRNAERCGGRRGGRSPTIERVDGTSIDVIGCRYTSTKTLLAPGTGAVFLTEHDIIWDRWEISQRSFAVLV